MHQAPYARGYFVGDYQGLDSQGSLFRALFTLAHRAMAGHNEDEYTLTDGERIAILLDMLGRKVRVVLDADAVEAA